MLNKIGFDIRIQKENIIFMKIFMYIIHFIKKKLAMLTMHVCFHIIQFDTETAGIYVRTSTGLSRAE